jgi:uncharacterized membrane protein YeaQ/YmgE (transglycosylase-associated protein family)
MTNESIMMMIVMGGVVGWLAGLDLRGGGYGVIGDVVVGCFVPEACGNASVVSGAVETTES